MIFQQFYLQSLGHASYLVGSEQTGEALVLDVLVTSTCILRQRASMACVCAMLPIRISTMII